MTKETDFSSLVKQLMWEREQLIDALRPFAVCSQVVDKSWECISGSLSQPGNHYVVLAHRHLQDADDTLTRLGLFYPNYEPKKGKN